MSMIDVPSKALREASLWSEPCDVNDSGTCICVGLSRDRTNTVRPTVESTSDPMIGKAAVLFWMSAGVVSLFCGGEEVAELTATWEWEEGESEQSRWRHNKDSQAGGVQLELWHACLVWRHSAAPVATHVLSMPYFSPGSWR